MKESDDELPRLPPEEDDDLSFPQTQKVICVNPRESKVRIDLFLKSKISWRSRNQLVESIKSGEITVNDKQVKSNYKVKTDDVVVIQLPPPPERCAASSDIPIEVVYEDDVMVVVNKPPGLVVHPVSGHPFGTMLNALFWRYRHGEKRADYKISPGLVNRIDQNTSGLVMAGLTPEVAAKLQQQFLSRSIVKEYLALVHGVPPEREGSIIMPIAQISEETLHRTVREDGDYAHTDYMLEDFFGDKYSLLRLRLHTGRTHQIRVHLQAIGCPILADHIYGRETQITERDLGGDSERIVLSRQALHSYHVIMTHPVTEQTLELHAPIPRDIQHAIDILRGNKITS